MQTILHYLLPASIACGISLLITPEVRKLAVRLGVMDLIKIRVQPLAQPTPKMGGIAIYLAFAITILLLIPFNIITDTKISLSTLGALLGAGALLMLGGYIDDRYDLPARLQIIFPIIAAMLMVSVGNISVAYVTNPLMPGNGPFGRSLLYLNFPLIPGIGAGSVLAFIWIVFTTYATKLLDGIEGLVSGLGIIAAIILFLISLFWDIPLSGTSVLIAIFGGALLGFWIYHIRPQHIFLGEGGSVFIGFMLGVFSLVSGAKIATTLLVFGLPLLDMLCVIGARLLAGKNPFTTGNDRRHLHFRLLDAGMSYTSVLLVFYTLSFIFGLSAVILGSFNKLIAIGVLGGVMALLLVWIQKKTHGKKNTV